MLLIVVGVTCMSVSSANAQSSSFLRFFKRAGNNVTFLNSLWELGSSSVRVAKGWFTDLDISGVLTLGGTVGSGGLDMNGNCLTLDADENSSLCADTDDQIDVAVGGADDFKFTVNVFTTLSGSAVIIEDGGLSMGTATLDAGAFTMTDGAQTGDDTFIIALSGDGAGNASFTTDDGSLIFASNDDISLTAVGANVTIETPSDATIGTTVVSSSSFSVNGSSWDTDDAVARDGGVGLSFSPTSSAVVGGTYNVAYIREGVVTATLFTVNSGGNMNVTSDVRAGSGDFESQTAGNGVRLIGRDVSDGSAIATTLRSSETLNTSGDKMVSIDNNGSEVSHIDRSGTYKSGNSFYGSANLRTFGVLLGSTTVDTDAITMTMGAQTGDPVTLMAMSSDDQGDFSITPDTGDIDLVPASNLDVTLTTSGLFAVDASTTTHANSTNATSFTGAWGNDNIGGVANVVSTTTSNGMTTASNGIVNFQALITNSASDAANTDLIAFYASAPTDSGGSAKLTAFSVATGYDTAFEFSSGNVEFIDYSPSISVLTSSAGNGDNYTLSASNAVTSGAGGSLVFNAGDALTSGLGGGFNIDLGVAAGVNPNGTFQLGLGGTPFSTISRDSSGETPVFVGYEDGGDATDVGVIVGANSNFVTAGSKLLSVRNNVTSAGGVEKFSVGYDGTVTITGNTTTTPIADATFVAADTVPSTGTVQRVAGNGAARSLTSTPSIADALADGICIRFFGTDGTNTLTFQDEDNLANTGLAFNGDVDIVLGLNDNFEVCYDSGDDLWVEISRNLTIDD